MLTSIFCRRALAVAAIASVFALLLLIRAENRSSAMEEAQLQTVTPVHQQTSVITPSATLPEASPERAVMERETRTWDPRAKPCTVISDEDWDQYIAAIGAANRDKDLEPLRIALLKAPSGHLCRQNNTRASINLLSMTTWHWSEEQLIALLQAGLSPSPDLLIGAARAGKARLQYLVELGIPFHDIHVQREIITMLITHRDLDTLLYVHNLGFNLGDREAGSSWLARTFLPTGNQDQRNGIQKLLIESGARLTQQDFDNLGSEMQQQVRVAAAEFDVDLIIRRD